MSWNNATRLVWTAFLLGAGSAAAHDIPSDVAARMIVRPAGERIEVAVRIPLSAVRDEEFPALPSGFLDVEALGRRLPDLAQLWVADRIALYEDGRRLPRLAVEAARISLPSDRSFRSFEEAARHVRGEALDDRTLRWEQVSFDVLAAAPIRSESARFEIRPGMEHLAERVVTALRFEAPGDEARVFHLESDPGRVPLDPSWAQAAGRFVVLGFEHILDGPDHLLFLLCLVVPFRRLRPLIWIVTAFTAAHSATLIASALGAAPTALWFPALVETLIAASVVYMALENIVGASRATRRWLLAFGFGLVHGFGFAFALGETLQFAGSHVWTSLLAFNVGVELGQIAVLLVMVPALGLLFQRVLDERKGAIILSALAAHTAWHWMTDRGSELLRYDFDWTAFTAADWASAARWAAAGVLVAGLLWTLARAFPARESGESTSRPAL